MLLDHGAAWGNHHATTWAVRMDLTTFENGSDNRGAYAVALGLGVTHYFRPSCQGLYLNWGVAMSNWALTSRPGGVLQTVNYVRPMGELGLGYRFNRNWSLAAEVRSADVDPNFSLTSVGLALGRHW